MRIPVLTVIIHKKASLRNACLHHNKNGYRLDLHFPNNFPLGMYDRIAVDFAGRRLHDFCTCLLASPSILMAPNTEVLIVFMASC